jgi:tRNA pseudouridine55 synthase
VRRLAHQKRVGHAGTLDPLAEGVLPVLLGRATRLADYIQAGRKTYVTVVQLGTATETDDTEGQIAAQRPVPPLSDTLVQATLTQFTGDILQVPPQYSALKVGGQRAYALARRGDEVRLAARPVTIDALRLTGRTDTTLTLEVSCSKGTYIRALARDIAQALGTVGHMASLCRTRVGPFSSSESLTVEEVASRGVTESLLTADCAIPDAERYSAEADAALRFGNGQALSVAGLRAGCVWVYDPLGRLIGLGLAQDDLLRPRLAL